MAEGKRSWITILVVSFVILAAVGLSVVGGAAYYVYRHVNAQKTTSESAVAELDRMRARFVGQEPLIEVAEEMNESVVRRHPQRAARDRPAGELNALNALAWSPHDNKLVRVSLPMWLLRRMPASKNVQLFGDDLDSSRVRLTVDDIEQHGPGLILDARRDSGTQILVWAE